MCIYTVIIWATSVLNGCCWHWISIVPRGNTGLDSYEPLVTTFSSTYQYATLFYECFCLKSPCLMYVVYSLTLNSQSTALNSRLNKSYLTHAFCPWGISQPLALRVDSTSALLLGAVFNSKNHHQKALACEKCGVKYKGHLFTAREMKREGRTQPCVTSESVCLWWLKILLPSACLWGTVKCHGSWFGGHK